MDGANFSEMCAYGVYMYIPQGLYDIWSGL